MLLFLSLCTGRLYVAVSIRAGGCLWVLARIRGHQAHDAVLLGQLTIKVSFI